MRPFNLNEDPPKCTFSDLRDPEPKPPRVPVYIQLHKLLKEDLGAAMSTGGQMFAYVPRMYNSFNVPLRSGFLKSWLTEHYTSTGNPPPSNQQMREALQAFESRATAGVSSGAPRQMNVRTAWCPMHSKPNPQFDKWGRLTGFDHVRSDFHPAIVFSLDTYLGRHVAVTPQGWSVQYTAAEFVYDPIQRKLPDPGPGPEVPAPETPEPPADPEAALSNFRKLLRIDEPRHDATWKTLLNWILAAMKPAKNEAFHDYPILNLVGPASSGKSVAAKILAQLIDPTGVPLNVLPTTERRLHVLAAAHHVLAFDNPGKINPEKSRYLSRLSTGVGSVYSQFQGMLVRPVILTTRMHLETKHLKTRVVDVELPRVQNCNLLSQQEIWEEFEKQRPQILAALLTLLSRDFDKPPVHLPNRKTKWQKIEESIPCLIEKQGGAWQGTVTDLQQSLNFPVSINALGRYLEETKSLEVTRTKNNKTVTVTLTLVLV